MHYLSRILSKNPLEEKGLFSKHVELRLEALTGKGAVSYTHLTLPTNREV